MRTKLTLPVATSGCGAVAIVIASGALAGSFHVSDEIAIAFLLGAFACALAGGILLLGAAKFVRTTELRDFERRLRDSEARHRALVTNAPLCILELDPEHRIHSVNPACLTMFGRSEPGELLTRELPELLAERDRPRAERMLEDAFGGAEAKGELHASVGGGERVFASSFIALGNGVSQPGAVMGVIEDITDARDMADELAHQARYDSLTGLVNRREFEQRLSRVLETARQDGSEHALGYLDLDQFKLVNDTCGHIAGDELLRQAGSMLQRAVRKRDTLARLGGDEFGVLIEHCSLEQARRVTEQMRHALDEFRFQWEDKTFNIRGSFGLVAISRESQGAEALMSAADRACYTAKDMGRNRIHVYHEDDEDLARRHGEMQWVSRLHHALDAGSFKLVSQPIVPMRLRADEGAHFELLLRMVGEDGELVPPGAFLPAAERYDLATRLDQWVVDRALDWLDSDAVDLDEVYLCAINLSGQSIANEEFLTFVSGRLQGREHLARRLCFEITETAAVANLAGAIRFIRTLHDFGCLFALDDFGSGLSSFAYLKTLPVDFLKIDGVFVRDMVDNPVDLAMVRSINEIGQVMGKRTIAEFAESERTVDMIRKLGIDYSQGYSTGAPRALEDGHDS